MSFLSILFDLTVLASLGLVLLSQRKILQTNRSLIDTNANLIESNMLLSKRVTALENKDLDAQFGRPLAKGPRFQP